MLPSLSLALCVHTIEHCICCTGHKPVGVDEFESRLLSNVNDTPTSTMAHIKSSLGLSGQVYRFASMLICPLQPMDTLFAFYFLFSLL